MEVLYNLPALYLLAINIATFSAFGADKRRARRESWRIPEKTLFLLSLLGGSAGALLLCRLRCRAVRSNDSLNGRFRQSKCKIHSIFQKIFPFFSVFS